MHRHLIAFTFVALPLAVALAHAQPGSPEGLRYGRYGNAVAQAFRPASESGLDLAPLERGARPRKDFYASACGGWTKTQPIPPDRSSWGVAERLQEQNETRLRKILEDAAKATDPETKKIGD